MCVGDSIIPNFRIDSIFLLDSHLILWSGTLLLKVPLFVTHDPVTKFFFYEVQSVWIGILIGSAADCRLKIKRYQFSLESAYVYSTVICKIKQDQACNIRVCLKK